ncbi:tetratricopeptide repeat protein [Candidatus Viadribacter manganicus]|uniref:Tetratricopeptide repeat protein n=1 Tax=Candidatus Viadribacter manganicus TaxID=1759059 RepID=A0A1B1AM17_9PROT|nr:tetratricopeptide repeat protein [Candidatus Viadribacter manganicus]ANP47560.1 hypothetical protein ATE48_17440 [Candidatus Viadribacter manganicus]
MRTWLLVTGLMTAALASAPVDAVAAERVDAVSANARAEIAAALYSASATQAVAERLADDRLSAAQREIERLRGEGDRARLQLIAAQEQYVSDLEQRSSAYQQEIAVFRQTVTEIAATPQGRRALALYAEGDPAAGRELLTRLMETRARAERRAADLRQAVDARRIATLDLDAMKSGRLDTLTVIADFELVTRLDGSQSSDWLQLARLYRDAGRLAQAEQASDRGLEAARSPAEIGRLQLERASIFSASINFEGQMRAGAEALAQLTAAAAAEPGVVSIRRDLLEAQLRASDDTEAELLTAVREAVAGAPNDLSLQLTYIDTLVQLGEDAADRQDYRAATANFSVIMDAIDAVSATDAERIAVDNARARVLGLQAEILERYGEVNELLSVRARRTSILSRIVDANPASAAQRELHAMSMVDFGVVLLSTGGVTGNEGEESRDGRWWIIEGIRRLRELTQANPSNPTTLLMFAGTLLSSSHLISADPDSAEALALWNEGVAAVEALARAYPNRIDLQNAAVGMMLMRIEQESDAGAKRALIAELMPRVRDLARSDGDDPGIQNIYVVALIEEAKVLDGAADLRERTRVEREADEFVRRAERRTPDYPAARLDVANLYRGLGGYYLDRNDTPLALERYERAFALQRAVWMSDPETTVFRDELADDMIRLGRRFYENGDTANGAQYFRNALDLFRGDAATGEDPEWREYLLLIRLHEYGDLLTERRDWAGAQAVIEERLALYRRRAAPDRISTERMIASELRELGRIASEQNDLERAASHLQEALAVAQPIAAAHADDASNQRLLGMIFDGLVDVSVKRARAAAERGDGALAESRWLEAAAAAQNRVEFRRRLASAPNAAPDAQSELANALVWLGNVHLTVRNQQAARIAFDEAVTLYRRLLGANPGSSEARTALAESLSTLSGLQDNNARELTLLQEMLTVYRQGPEDPVREYRVAYAHFSIALTEERLSRMDRAAASFSQGFTVFRHLMTQYPDYASLKGELVNIMTGVGDRGLLSAADRQWLEETRASDPVLAQTYHRRQCANEGDAYSPEQRIAGCSGVLDAADTTSEQRALALGNRGNAYFAQRDYVRAGADYDELTRIEPQNAAAFYNLSLVHRSQGDHSRAIADVDHAASIEPDNARFQNGRCWSRAVSGLELDVARAACDAALRLRPGDAATYNSRGMVGLKQERWQDAWNDYDAAVRAAPDRATHHYGRGIAALRLGRIAEGEADIAHALTLDANIAQTYAGYGVTR